MQPGHHLIRRFILLSAVAHGLLLAFLLSPGDSRRTVGSVVHVALVPMQAPAAQTPQTQPVSAPTVPATPVPSRQPAASRTQPQPIDKPRPGTTRPRTGVRDNNHRTTDRRENPLFAPPAAGPERTPAPLLQYMHAAFAEYFSYPRSARINGWQGRVTLGLRLEADGRLTDIRVLETSGYGILDRTAVSSARRITRVPDVIRWLKGNHLDIVLPVEYRLVDS